MLGIEFQFNSNSIPIHHVTYYPIFILSLSYPIFNSLISILFEALELCLLPFLHAIYHFLNYPPYIPHLIPAPRVSSEPLLELGTGNALRQRREVHQLFEEPQTKNWHELVSKQLHQGGEAERAKELRIE